MMLRAAIALAASLVAMQTPAQSDEPRARATQLMNELMSGKAAVGVPFTLTNQHGKRVSLADFLFQNLRWLRL